MNGPVYQRITVEHAIEDQLFQLQQELDAVNSESVHLYQTVTRALNALRDGNYGVAQDILQETLT